MDRANFIGAFNQGYSSQTCYGSTDAGSDTQISGRFQDLDLELYNSSGTRIARSRNSGTSTDTISLNGLANGTYFVRVIPSVIGTRSAYALRFGLNVQ